MLAAILLAAGLAAEASGAQPPAADPPSAAELRVVEYLKEHVQPHERVVVSELYNEVFTSAEERAVLSRLFNSFFKLPLYLAQQQKASGRPPTLAEISEQFHFRVQGEADVLLRIMEFDPRMPRLIRRNPVSGEIAVVYVDRILADPRFGKALEHTIAGWEGTPAPAFTTTDYTGAEIGSAQLAGRAYLLYFWFTNCPPCVRTGPLLVELEKRYAARGFRVIGLNADRVLELPYGDEERRAYAERHGLSFTLAYATAAIQEAYGSVSVYPTLFFVDAHGTIVKQLVSEQETAALEAAARLALQ
jgi:thiol-disulfide isomerase/thioredoxin